MFNKINIYLNRMLFKYEYSIYPDVATPEMPYR